MNPKAQALRTKLDEWKKWMSCDDTQYIGSTIQQMMQEDAVFRMIIKCWEIGPKDKDGRDLFNSEIYNLILQSFFKMQSLYIRQLTEKNPGNKKRGIISLRRFLDEVIKNADSLRRDYFFEAHEILYNLDHAERDESDYWGEVVNGPETSQRDFKRWRSFKRSSSVHSDFDKWSGVPDPSQRKSDDLIPRSVFEEMQKKLETTEDIKQFVDKRVAHRAHPTESLPCIPEKNRTVCLEKIWKCHRVIFEVASDLSKMILRENLHWGIPHEMPNTFAHLDQPWVETDQIQRLKRVWKEHQAEVETWRGGTLKTPWLDD